MPNAIPRRGSLRREAVCHSLAVEASIVQKIMPVEDSVDGERKPLDVGNLVDIDLTEAAMKLVGKR